MVTQLSNTIRAAMQTRDNIAIMKTLHNPDSEAIVRDIGKEYDSLANVLTLSDRLATASEGALNKLQAIQALFFATVIMPKEVERGETYFDPENSAYALMLLPCYMEYDTQTKKTIFIFHDRMIGSGAFKKVYRGLLTDNTYTTYQQIAYALATGDLSKEVRNHERTNGLPGVLQALAITHHKRGGQMLRSAIVSHFYKTGNLKSFVNSSTQPPAIQKIIQIAKHVLTGLVELHKKGMTHRDLKPANILLEQNGNTINAVIGDLGLTRTIDEAKTGDDPQSRKGLVPNATTAYNPPEAYENRKKTRYRHADVFSLGVVFNYMLTKRDAPWMTTKIMDKAIMNGDSKTKKAACLQNFSKKLTAYREKMRKSIAPKKSHHSKRRPVRHPSADTILKNKFKGIILEMLKSKDQRPAAAVLFAKVNALRAS